MFARSVVAVVVAALAVAGAVSPPATPLAVGVEDDGVDCPVTLPGSLTSNSRLPDPFTKLDGSRITAKSEWRCRRAEIKRLAERYVYGEKPLALDPAEALAMLELARQRGLRVGSAPDTVLGTGVQTEKGDCMGAGT